MVDSLQSKNQKISCALQNTLNILLTNDPILCNYSCEENNYNPIARRVL